jgi:phosphoribosyl-AMP cyclohydrolase
MRDNGTVPDPTRRLLDVASLDAVRYDDRGLVPVVVQEATTRQILMLAWMDAQALRRTAETGRATYWSRSRETYWVKGETSGHTQQVREVRLDCDGDAVLLVVDQTGPACHTGATTCFDVLRGHDA